MSLARAEYWTLSWKALREGRGAWLARQASKLVTVPLGDALGRPLDGPVFGTLLLTYRCTNACVMCEFPRRGRREQRAGRVELDTAAFARVIDDFAAIGTTGVAIIGGEPTLRPDLNELLRHVKRRGLIANITTNGSQLADAAAARRLLETGIDLINVSIDGADAATHDALRGRPGNFDELCAAIRHLARLRPHVNPRAVLNAIAVLSPRNLHQAEAIARLAHELGCDHVGYMPVHDFDYMDAPLNHGDPAWLDEARQAIARLKERRHDLHVDSSDEYLDLFPRAFRGDPSDLRCYVGYVNVMVSPYGDVFPCEPFLRARRSVGNVLETPLREVWKSTAYREARRDIASCRACYWNCTTELNLLYNRMLPSRGPSAPRAAARQSP